MISLESLYEEYLSSGTCDAEAFLDAKSEHNYLESLDGQWLELVSTPDMCGPFLCLELQMSRPTHYSDLGFFLESRGRVRKIEDPLEFLESCSPGTEKMGDVEKIQWSKALKEAVSEWLVDRVRVYERKREHEFNEDLEKLREYYQEFAAEMEERKKAIFFHNYFFEKEARLKEEYSSMVDDLTEQGKNLHGRYKTVMEVRVLFQGVVRS